MNLKLFSILMFLSNVFFGEIDSSGWATLPKPSPQIEETFLSDEETWVVFSKQMEKEKFVAQFPGEPEYSYTKEGMSISSWKDKEKFSLFVHSNENVSIFEERMNQIRSLPEIYFFEIEQMGSDTLDFIYQVEGKWVREHLLKTSNHVYIFQTISPEFFSENHLVFIDSLHVKSPL